MAEKRQGIVSGLLSRLRDQRSDLYKDTYYTTNDNNEMLDKLSSDINISIQKAVNDGDDRKMLSNTTKLYTQIMNHRGSESSKANLLISGKNINNGGGNDKNASNYNDFDEFFNNPQMIGNLMTTYTDSKHIKIFQDEIDMCLKYMPKLKTALDIKKNNVLSADSFTKSFVIPKLVKQGKSDRDQFPKEISEIIKKYDFEKKLEDYYDLAAKYGEVFVYRVPYKKAFAELLRRKSTTSTAVTENSLNFDKRKNNISVQPYLKGVGNGNFKLVIDKTGILGESVVARQKAIKTLTESAFCIGLCENLQDLNEYSINEDKATEELTKRVVGDNLEYKDISQDGLIDKKNRNITPDKIKVPGAVIRLLENDKIIPLVMEDIILGYYYIKFDINNLVDVNTSSLNAGYNGMTSMFNNSIEQGKSSNVDDGNIILRDIASKISSHIDSSFINNNQDLSKEIYMMLKYNDTYNQAAGYEMRVTFIPPDDIQWLKFNENPITKRGRSDLWDGLLAAKMWIMMDSTYVIGSITRSQDKRVYYVKTQIENNVAQTMLNVVEQVKKGNFGMRQMESINNILQITGKFNDYVIPLGPSGDPPITFDIMPGQDFSIPTELMDKLEDSAVSGITPLEIVNSSMQMDYAIRYTMTNARMLKDVVKRQQVVSKFGSEFLTMLYNCEYQDNAEVEMTLPIPTFLMVTQGAQMIQSITEYVNGITEFKIADGNDEDKAVFRNKLINNYIATFVDENIIEKIKEEMAIEASENKTRSKVGQDE